jgi:hypothetical protein
MALEGGMVIVFSTQAQYRFTSCLGELLDADLPCFL